MDRGKDLADLRIDEARSAAMRDRHGGIRWSNSLRTVPSVTPSPSLAALPPHLVVLAPLMPPARLFYLLVAAVKRGRGRGGGPAARSTSCLTLDPGVLRQGVRQCPRRDSNPCYSLERAVT